MKVYKTPREEISRGVWLFKATFIENIILEISFFIIGWFDFLNGYRSA